jgi:hypothetical protein
VASNVSIKHQYCHYHTAIQRLVRITKDPTQTGVIMITLSIIDLLVVFTFYVTASVSMFYFLLDYGTVLIVWYILFHLSFLDFVFDDNILSFLFFIINKFNLEYGGTFIKLFMPVSSRNMFPTTRNLQIRVHVYRPCHYCGD